MSQQCTYTWVAIRGPNISSNTPHQTHGGLNNLSLPNNSPNLTVACDFVKKSVICSSERIYGSGMVPKRKYWWVKWQLISTWFVLSWKNILLAIFTALWLSQTRGGVVRVTPRSARSLLTWTISLVVVVSEGDRWLVDLRCRRSLLGRHCSMSSRFDLRCWFG